MIDRVLIFSYTALLLCVGVLATAAAASASVLALVAFLMLCPAAVHEARRLRD